METRAAVAPDCGLKYPPRDVAFAKKKALAAGNAACPPARGAF